MLEKSQGRDSRVEFKNLRYFLNNPVKGSLDMTIRVSVPGSSGQQRQLEMEGEPRG